jgi:hypothetical protein
VNLHSTRHTAQHGAMYTRVLIALMLLGMVHWMAEAGLWEGLPDGSLTIAVSSLVIFAGSYYSLLQHRYASDQVRVAARAPRPVCASDGFHVVLAGRGCSQRL